MSDLRWLLDNVPENSIEEHALEIEAAIKENAALKRVGVAARLFWETVDAIPGMEDLSQQGNGRVLYEALTAVEDLPDDQT